MRAKSELEAIPGVGVRMARHLERIGCLSQGCQVDRCVLYVYRLAVHYAEHGQCPPDKQNWWDWKDK